MSAAHFPSSSEVHPENQTKTAMEPKTSKGKTTAKERGGASDPQPTQHTHRGAHHSSKKDSKREKDAAAVPAHELPPAAGRLREGRA